MKRIAVFSLIISIFLVAIKIAVSYFTNSIGVFSEALNNGLDIVTALITYLAVRMSLRPADKDHTYGHGKYENLSAFIEIIIISALSFFIIYKSVLRIIYRNIELKLNTYVFIILVLAIFINLIRVFFLGRTAMKYNSFALRAEFINYSSDILSSIIVIAGLYLADIGIYIADPIASIIVALIVLTFSIRLSIRVIRNLLDYIPKEITDRITGILGEIKEIESINKLKIHEVGNTKFVNMEIFVGSNLYLSQVEKLKKKVKRKILEKVPDSEIIIETRLIEIKSDIEEKIREIVTSNKNIKDVHNIFIYNIKNSVYVTLHVRLDENLSLENADKLTNTIEKRIKDKINKIRRVYIHIEDFTCSEHWNDVTDESDGLIDSVKREISSYVDPETCHNFTVLKKGELYNLAFHCRLKKNVSVKKAHSVITKIENDIKKKFNDICSISIHVEPR
jgi:cation diffusion facilitator family transporter